MITKIQILFQKGLRQTMTQFFPTIWPFLTSSIICRTVFNRTTPLDFSDPASFGSVSAKAKNKELINFFRSQDQRLQTSISNDWTSDVKSRPKVKTMRRNHTTSLTEI